MNKRQKAHDEIRHELLTLLLRAEAKIGTQGLAHLLLSNGVALLRSEYDEGYVNKLFCDLMGSFDARQARESSFKH